MKHNQWRSEFEKELLMAESARSMGNEGMARVCARRAAGVVVRAYFRQKNIAYSGSSVYEHLRQLINLPETSAPVAGIAGRLLLRVTPEHKLPVDADLIEDARRLASELCAIDK